MQTPTHLLIAAAVFARPGAHPVNAAALAGGLLPDAFLIGVWGWSKAAGIAEDELWRRIYWTDWVQAGQAVSNSLPLFVAIFAAALAMRFRAAAVFAAAAILHLVCDFLLHAKDAHQHFWPLSSWRFESPVSYWDPAHFGTYVAILEAVFGTALMAILFQRFTRFWVRSIVLLAGIPYLALPIYFVLSLGGG